MKNQKTLCVIPAINLFSLKQDMNTHMKIKHHHKKDHKCESCDRAFSTSGDLQRHISVVHHKKRDIKCEVCQKALTSNTNMMRHYSVLHEGKKVHDCKLCSFGPPLGLGQPWGQVGI